MHRSYTDDLLPAATTEKVRELGSRSYIYIILAVAILPPEAKEPHVILPFGGKIVLTAILPQVPK